jgi:hypothetical protein
MTATSPNAARDTFLRLACFAALWLIAFAVRGARRADPDWMTKVALLAAFAVPAVLLLWFVQRLARYRIPWLVELFAMPFAVGASAYAAIAIRDLVGRTA